MKDTSHDEKPPAWLTQGLPKRVWKLASLDDGISLELLRDGSSEPEFTLLIDPDAGGQLVDCTMSNTQARELTRLLQVAAIYIDGYMDDV